MAKKNKPSSAEADTRALSGGRRSGRQVAALPYRVSRDVVEFALITRRTTKRWIIPKGWTEKGFEARHMAETEALEEAGLRGAVSKLPIGLYHYDKILDDGSAQPCEVTVYGLKVKSRRKKFKESGERELRWFAPQEASARVDEDDLAMLILHFARILKGETRTT